MPKWSFFLFWLVVLIAIPLWGLEVDATKSATEHIEYQGALDASTLAGADQQHQKVLSTNSFGMPQTWQYVVDPIAAQAMADQTWQKNLSGFTNTGEQVGDPTWTIPDDFSVRGNVDVTMHLNVAKQLSQNTYGEIPNLVDEFVLNENSISSIPDKIYP